MDMAAAGKSREQLKEDALAELSHALSWALL
jgi:hypothetical protein